MAQLVQMMAQNAECGHILLGREPAAKAAHLAMNYLLRRRSYRLPLPGTSLNGTLQVIDVKQADAIYLAHRGIDVTRDCQVNHHQQAVFPGACNLFSLFTRNDVTWRRTRAHHNVCRLKVAPS